MTDTAERLAAALSDRYRIEREAGQGGMATVYVADDLKHDRKVAVKVLQPDLAAVLGAERFLQEIKTTAHLQHPHILPLFDSGQAGGFLYYVMPFVEGETLRDRLNRETQLSVQEALTITTEVAGALGYAHRRHVIHRDIKPENILLHDGQAIVSDFGIALALQTAGGARLTETGLSMGTPQYMSPEQVTAERELDGRSDVYSLAATLFEMLVGRPPFEAATAQAVVAKILTQEPPRVSAERHTVPAHVESAIHKALAKLPADRFATASQFSQALADASALARDTVTASVSPRARARGVELRRWQVTALWGAVFVASGAAAWSWRARTMSRPPEVVRTVIALSSDQVPFIDIWSSPVAVSPDGSMLAYTAARGATSQLYLRPLAAFAPQAVSGTEGAHAPFFSPDGRRVGFMAAGKVWQVSAAGGAPVPICDVGDDRGGAAWAQDGMIYFTDTDGLMRVDADGGAPELIRPFRADDGEQSFRFPQALPDGRILLTMVTDPGTARGAVFDPETGHLQTILEGVGARYLASGHLVLTRAGVLQVARFDLDRLELTSSPVPVPDEMYNTILGNGVFSVSDGGTLVYLPDSAAVRHAGGSSGTSRLVRVTRDGREATLQDDWPGSGRPRLSPDRRFAVDYVPADAADATSNFHVWIFDVARGTGQRLTTDRTNVYPVWTPDGRRITFSSTLLGAMDLFWVPADGSAPPEPLLIREYEQFATSWSPDGTVLAFYERNPETRFDIWVLRTTDSTDARPFARGPSNEVDPAFAPDGRWIAYSSDASGRYDVYVQPFPRGGGAVRISTTGGRRPMWAPDGSELYYREGDRMWAVAVQTAPTLDVGAPELLFEGPYAMDFDVDPSGAGFVMVRIVAPSEPSRFHVVQNWFTELERLVEGGH